MNSTVACFAALLLSVFLCSCDSQTKWKSGSYSVSWLDADLVLWLDVDDGNAIGRVMHKVSAVGEDDTWIVAERHPKGDESITEYYYFSKADDHQHKNANEIVLGPFTKSAFDKLKRDLNLPDFSERF